MISQLTLKLREVTMNTRITNSILKLYKKKDLTSCLECLNIIDRVRYLTPLIMSILKEYINSQYPSVRILSMTVSRNVIMNTHDTIEFIIRNKSIDSDDRLIELLNFLYLKKLFSYTVFDLASKYITNNNKVIRILSLKLLGQSTQSYQEYIESIINMSDEEDKDVLEEIISSYKIMLNTLYFIINS